MFLKSLKLTHFRNYQKLDFNFDKQITVLIGNNAQGKSNFLESIYILATTKSPKADKDEELIHTGEEFVRVEGEVRLQVTGDSEQESTNLEIAMQLVEQSLRKKAKVNGIPRRVSDYSENLAVVLFAPEDVNLVSGSPSLRRNHLDQTMSQTDREYKRSLSNYENVVIRKNRILKAINEGKASIDQLDYWANQQVLSGEILIEKRKDFFEFINGSEKKFGEYSYDYLCNTISKERIAEYQQKEILSSSSLIGPHRDDFMFMLNGRDLAKFGSRGEQRTAVLDLKLSEVAFMENKLSSRPILLLDDIFSELDEAHREHVVSLSKLQQTVIATVEFDRYLRDLLKDANWFRVEKGILTPFKT
jgi:DNA replication and repair protein RecF